MPRKSRKEYQRAWREKNPGKSASYTAAWRRNNRARARKLARERMQRDLLKVKAELIAAYGGKCSCCGEDDPHFLSLDHMKKGDGQAHRKRFKTAFKIYQHLKKLGFPKKGYRLLCFNCNMAWYIWGCCPHQPEFEKKAVRHKKKLSRERCLPLT